MNKVTLRHFITSTLLTSSLLSFSSWAGDAQRGAEIFRVCQSCHAIGENAQHRVGPQLNGLFGRQAGSLEDFGYSDDLKSAGINGLIWDAKHLDAYLTNPVALITGTNMNFGGIDNPTDRDDLIAFLRTYSASPSDIPESQPTLAFTDPEVDPEILSIVGDPEYGEYLSAECKTCHQADGTDQGIPSITGWPESQFVIVMHAYKNKARPHPVMQMMAANLADEEIAALAAYFGKY